jgi:hypothetical protein
LLLSTLVAAPSLAGQARILDATVLDKAVPPEQVAAALQLSLRPLGGCFRVSDAGSAEVGRGEVAFEISSSGRAAHVTVSGELDSGCVEREAVRWRFPAPSTESPQVFVTLELDAGADHFLPAGREREELESFCTLVQQYQARTTKDPRQLPRKVLRTLLGAGMTLSGQRWASEMLAAEPEAQLEIFRQAARDRGLDIECPEYVGWFQRTFGSDAGAHRAPAGGR